MKQKLLDPISSAQDRRLIEQYLIQSRKDANFLNAHWPDWVAEHPDKWVAVFEEEMVGLGDTFDKVIRAAEAKGAPRGRIVVEFLATNPIAMILAPGPVRSGLAHFKEAFEKSESLNQRNRFV